MVPVEKVVAPVNGQSEIIGADLPDGQVRIPLAAPYEREWAIVDTDKMSYAWTEAFNGDASKQPDLISQVLISVSFAGYKLDAESLRTAWFIKKYHALLFGVLEYLAGPNEETSPNSKS